MVLLAFRHGLRASELCALRWDQIDLAHGRLHVARRRMARRARIRSPAGNCAPCAACSASRSPAVTSFSPNVTPP
jgi:hypothetical protein